MNSEATARELELVRREREMKAKESAARKDRDRYRRLPEGKADLLQRVETQWTTLQRRLASLSGHELDIRGEGGWAAKDHLAHLMEWERYLRLHHIWGFPAAEVLGVDECTWRALDEDGLNAILLERHKDRSLSEVVEALEYSHRGVMRELKLMPFQMMLEQAHPEDPEGRPLLAWIASNTYEHYREHRLAIEGLLPPKYSGVAVKAQPQRASCIL